MGDLFARLSFTDRSYKTKIKRDIFANYAIASQCKSCNYPEKFVQSLKLPSLLDESNLQDFKEYCCTHQYLSPHNDFSFEHSPSVQPRFENKLFAENKADKSSKLMDQQAIQSGFFDPHFYQVSNPDLPLRNPKNLFDHFLKNSFKESHRDPSQYFSVSKYYSFNPDVKNAKKNALLHFLEHGNRRYASSDKVLNQISSKRDCIDILDKNIRRKFTSTALIESKRVCIYLHIHYPEAINNFVEAVLRLPKNVKILISTTSAEKQQQILELIESNLLLERLDLCFVYTENRGRDLGAFIAVYGHLMNYDVVCKLHAKKSPHLGDFGNNWFHYLLQSTIFNIDAVANIVEILSSSEDIGILAPTPFTGTNNVDWGDNYSISNQISKNIFGSKLHLNENNLRYPSGTVFWFKPDALDHAQFRSLCSDFFPEEPIPTDGTTAHALERIIPSIALLNDYHTLYYFDPSLYLASTHEWRIFDCIKNFDSRDVVVIFGHDASNSGAPRVALALQRSVIHDLGLNCVVVLLNDGPLIHEYISNGPVFVFKNNISNDYMASVFKYTSRSLNVITNTVITSRMGNLSQQFGHSHIALVHENANSGYWSKDMFRRSLNADLCVFPGKGVANAAQDFCGYVPSTNILIRPQGMYRHNFPEVSLEKSYASVRLELGLPDDAKIVLGCGNIEERKGVDMFFETALKYCDLGETCSNTYFVWIGGIVPAQSSTRDWGLALLNKLKALKSTKFFIIAGVTKVDRYYQACDLFYLSSRKDPFPGVVLEAMACKKPILAFAGATDVADAFGHGLGGTLLQKFDSKEAAQKVHSYLSNPNLCVQAGEHNDNVIQSKYKFEHYSRAIFDKLKSLKSGNILLSESDLVMSFVAPVYKTPLLYLQQLLSSLESQTYSKWELCLAGGELDSGTRAYLNFKLLCDNRIKYQEVEPEKQGISANTNAAISISTGNYIALLDHDDLLPPHCVLQLIHSHISENADFIYTAEDKVDSSGLRFYAPVYKTDFSEELLLAYNYITHLSSFSRHLITEVGLFDSKFDGAQDYDFILRASLKASKIYYLPRILYHWRVFEGSTSDGRSASKPYAVEAGKNAILTYLTQKGHEKFYVNHGKLPFTYHVEFYA